MCPCVFVCVCVRVCASLLACVSLCLRVACVGACDGMCFRVRVCAFASACFCMRAFARVGACDFCVRAFARVHNYAFTGTRGCLHACVDARIVLACACLLERARACAPSRAPSRAPARQCLCFEILPFFPRKGNQSEHHNACASHLIQLAFTLGVQVTPRKQLCESKCCQVSQSQTTLWKSLFAASANQSAQVISTQVALRKQFCT